MTCQVCGRPVDDPRSAYVHITGWERPGRGAGGRSGSSLVLRRPTGKLAHSDCITKLRTRVSPEQGTLQ